MTGFVKGDAGKPKLEIVDPLVPLGALDKMTQVLQYGAEKYTREVDGAVVSGADNWRQCDDWDRYYHAALRHLRAYRRGEDTDSESGLPHLAHAACCLFFLMERPSGK